MIELTLEQLINSVEILQRISTASLKAKTAFMIAKLLREADVEINNFNETRISLIKKYGQKDENGELKPDENNNVQIEVENINDFNSELQELLNTKVIINSNKINFDDLNSIELTPAEAIRLEPFVELE